MGREVSAGFIVFRRTKEGPKYLLMYHGRSYWNFPKGKLEMNERTAQAAIRELREETGLRLSDLHWHRNFKEYERFQFRRKHERVFKVVTFYLAETHQSQIRLSSEHEGYGWFTLGEAQKLFMKYKETFETLKRAAAVVQPRRTHSLQKQGEGKGCMPKEREGRENKTVLSTSHRNEAHDEKRAAK